jgi:hypothetical protein
MVIAARPLCLTNAMHVIRQELHATDAMMDTISMIVEIAAYRLCLPNAIGAILQVLLVRIVKMVISSNKIQNVALLN